MCQFSQLDTGEKVELSTLGDTQCVACNSHIFNYNGPAIYQGHEDNGGMIVDSFLVLSNWQCVCGERITKYITPCDDHGSLLSLPVYKFVFSETTNDSTNS